MNFLNDFLRHVILPPEIAKLVPKGKLLSEQEWRRIGVEQSVGWEHYAVHRPEPHILLFRRLLALSPAPPPGSLPQKNQVHMTQISQAQLLH